ncbi:MAG: DUF4203 domain-containing protein [Candidatus Dadabacteria bacterium]|nr:DUF4203 domain-containing protein [Candidatus Dadabacteria bacterium]
MTLSPLMYNFLLAAVVLLGVLICFFGYRMVKFVLAVAGFILGASFVAGFGFTLTDGKEIVVILIAAVAGGLIVGALFLFLYSAGVFLIGAIFGILLFSGIIGFVNSNTSPILYILPALVGGILALLLQKFMIILITSFTGAWVSVMAVLYFISSDFSPFRLEFIDRLGENQTYRIVFSWLALGMLGFITQYIIFPKKVKNTEAVALSDEQGV